MAKGIGSIEINTNKGAVFQEFDGYELTPNPLPERRADWKPDPNRPDRLYYSRDSGYKRVKVMSGKGTGSLVLLSDFSSIFIGEKLEGNYLHVLKCNGDDVVGWIDAKASGMILSEIPQKVLASLIPPKVKEPEIWRYGVTPEEGNYMYIPHMKTKDYNNPQPDTVVLWKDKPDTPGWLRTTPESHWLMFDLLKVAAPEHSIIYYVMAYAYHYADNRFWTDLKNKDLHRDDILGLNPDKECFYVKNSITTRGNTVEILERNGTEARLGGIDLSKPLPYAEDILYKPEWVHLATQQYPEILENGKPKSTHFPSLKQTVDGKKEKTGTPFPRFLETSYANTYGMVSLIGGQKTEHVNLSRWV